jgi:hypothetical protein
MEVELRFDPDRPSWAFPLAKVLQRGVFVAIVYQVSPDSWCCVGEGTLYNFQRAPVEGTTAMEAVTRFLESV